MARTPFRSALKRSRRKIGWRRYTRPTFRRSLARFTSSRAIPRCDNDAPAGESGVDMGLKHLVLLGASFFALPFAGPSAAQEPAERYVQLAELEIDPAQIEAYKAAVKEHIETATRVEPGVLV